MDESQLDDDHSREGAASTLQAEEPANEGDARLAERLRLQLHDRLEAINAHCMDVKDNPSPLTAVLRRVCGDLLEVEAHVAEAFRVAVSSAPLTTESLQDYEGSIDLLLRLSKQVVQLAQLDVRTSKKEA